MEDTLTSSTIKAYTPCGLLNLKADLWNIINNEFVKLITLTRTLEDRSLRTFVSGIWISILEDGNQGIPYYTIDLSQEMKKLFFKVSLDKALLFCERITDCPDSGFNRKAYNSAINDVLSRYGMGFGAPKKSPANDDHTQQFFHYKYSLQ